MMIKPMNQPAVAAVAFDVNETLFCLDRLRPAFGEVGLDPALVPLWFARVLRDGFALTTMGEFRSFADVADQTLRGPAPDRVDDAAVGTVLGAMRELDAHPDAEPALRLLREAGIPAVTLTNGSSEVVAAMLDRAGLTGHLRHNLSVDAVPVERGGTPGVAHGGHEENRC
jgi:2-haloacid dehalogenase